MRIRKRQVPFPLSSLSPIPLSDLNLNLNLYPSSPLVVQQHLQPSDQPNQPIGNSSTVPVADGPHEENNNNNHNNNNNNNNKELGMMMMMMMPYEEEEEEEEDKRKSNDSKKGSIFGVETSTGVVHPLSASSSSSSHHQVVGRWCEGEKAFPLKKRRGSFELKSSSSNGGEEKELIVEGENKKAKKMMMKTKVNKKCGVQKEEKETTEEKDANTSNNGGKKKGSRGGALMEGSRCSRVNGRGWRCCQQTLVGYSLCEHHLGKGRLRSMANVRGRAMSASKKDNAVKLLSTSALSTSVLGNHEQPMHNLLSNDDDDDDDDDEEDEKKKTIMAMTTTTTTKKRMKLGTVKARSLSSLLGQTNNVVGKYKV